MGSCSIEEEDEDEEEDDDDDVTALLVVDLAVPYCAPRTISRQRFLSRQS